MVRIMEISALLESATRLKQGLLAKAISGEYVDSDFQSDIAVLSANQRIEKCYLYVICDIINYNYSQPMFCQSR